MIVVFQKMLAHPSEECGVGALERGGDNPLGELRGWSLSWLSTYVGYGGMGEYVG